MSLMLGKLQKVISYHQAMS